MFNYQWWHWLYICPSPIYICLFIQTNFCHTRLSFSKFTGWSSVWSWTWVSYDLFFDSLWSHFLLFFGQICRKRSCYQVIYYFFSYNLFVTSKKPETTNSPILQFTNMKWGKKAREHFKYPFWHCIISYLLL